MPEDKKWEIADAADMIVSGFAFKRWSEDSENGFYER